MGRRNLADLLREMMQRFSSPEQLLERLCALAGELAGKGKEGLVRPKEASDPGLILMELLTLLHWNALYHLSAEMGQLLLNVFQVAGLVRRPARPALTLMSISGAVGTAVQRTTIFLPPASSIEQAATSADDGAAAEGGDIDDFRFSPAWGFVCWDANARAERHDGQWCWQVKVPGDFIDRRGDWLHAYLEGVGVDNELPCFQEGDWAFFDEKKKGYRLRVEHPLLWWRNHAASLRWCFAGLGESTEELVERWLYLTHSTGDEPVRPNGLPELNVKDGFNGWLVCKSGFAWGNGGAVSPATLKPTLRANRVLCVNLSDEVPMPPDHVAAASLPQGRCAGEKANGIPAVKDWECRTNSALQAESLLSTAGGQRAESDVDFLARAPGVLRQRGAPVAADDWVHLVLSVDPLRRIAGAAVRELFFPESIECVVGVEITYHCRGAACAAQRLGHWLHPEIKHLLDLIRPLGTFVKIRRPHLVEGKLELDLSDVPKERREGIRKDVFKLVSLDVPDPSRASPEDFKSATSFWQFLLQRFSHVLDRKLGPGELIERWIAEKTRIGAADVKFKYKTSSLPLEDDAWPVPYVAAEADVKEKGERP